MDDLSLAVGFRKLRKSFNLNQEDFAKKVGISQTYVSDLENNRKNPTINTLIQILEPFDIPYLDFLIKCELTTREKEIETSWDNPNIDTIVKNIEVVEHLNKVITFYEDYTSDLLKETSRDYREDIIDLKETGYEYRLELDKILIQVEE